MVTSGNKVGCLCDGCHVLAADSRNVSHCHSIVNLRFFLFGVGSMDREKTAWYSMCLLRESSAEHSDTRMWFGIYKQDLILLFTFWVSTQFHAWFQRGEGKKVKPSAVWYLENRQWSESCCASSEHLSVMLVWAPAWSQIHFQRDARKDV